MTKYLKKLYIGIALTLNLIVAALFLFSAYSDHISPETSVLPAYAGLAFPVFLALNIAFLLFWVLQGNKLFLLSVIALAIGWSSIRIYSPFHFRISPKPGKELTLLTYNVCELGRLSSPTVERPNKILDYIRKTDADIVCLQEYAFGTRAPLITEDQIRKTLSVYPYYVFIRNTQNSYSQNGIALFSKYPIVHAEKINLGSAFNGAVLYQLEIDGRKLTLINNHLESNKFTEVDREFYDYMLKNFEVNLLGEAKNRLLVKLGKAYKLRAAQADKIAAIVRNQGDDIIVCGDFNDTPQSYVYHTIKGNLKDAYVQTGSGPGITYYANHFWFRIDHVLYGKNLQAVKTTIGKEKYSDHYPVKVVFRWSD